MRIDFVITELFPGGAERCLTELAIRLNSLGDQTRVFSIGSLPTGEQALLVDRLREAGVDVRTACADHWASFPMALRKLRHWFAEDPADLCQTFLFHANVLGTQAAGPFDMIRCGGLRVAEAKRGRLWLETRAVAKMDSLICVSEATRAFASQRLAADPNKLTVIGNSVDLDRFQDTVPMRWSEIGWPDDSLVTLFVGRLHHQKGIDLLQDQIDAIAPVGTNHRLLLIGEGPLEDALSQWTMKLGETRVRRLPWQRDIAPMMRAAQLLVLPSRYEGMPNVVLEAMASGIPVVCSRVEGSHELLSHRFEAQCFAPEDSVAMASLINQIQSDTVLADTLGKANAERAAEDFAIPAMVDRYRKHYSTLMACD